MECDICFENFENKIKVTYPCQHMTCLDCFCKVRKPISCHICRKDVSIFIPSALTKKKYVSDVIVIAQERSNIVLNMQRIGMRRRRVE